MLWIIIVGLIVVGLVLLVIEIVFIPGTTVVGILGLAFAIGGVSLSYTNFGNDVGFIVLMSTLVLTLITLYFSFKKGAWEAFALKSSIDSRVNEGTTNVLSVGDEGITTSVLRPIGKAELKGEVFEVKSTTGYIAAGEKIKVISIEGNQIIVEITT